MIKDLEEIKVAGFVLRPNSPEIRDLFLKIKPQFESEGIEVFLDESSARSIGLNGINFNQMCEVSDFLVSLGGDGTLLSLVRNSYSQQKPIVGINAGDLGFLADVKIDEVPEFLVELKAGEYRIDERMMISGFIKKIDGSVIDFFALNDVVITSPVPSKMVWLNAYIGGEQFNTYRGDGVIISTPTGSTAYNLSAGGPVVYPLTKAFIITPVLAHSLTNQRPLVVPINFYLEFDLVEDNATISIDGQERYDFQKGDTLHISGASKSANLIHRNKRDYFEILREKLSWGGLKG